MTATFADLETLARTVYGEARGEGREGWAAVAWVIRNRARDTRWPGTVAAVCKQKWQFSAWNDSDPNRLKLLAVQASSVTMAQIIGECARVLAGLTEDPTDGANHYCTIELAENRPPKWYDPSKVTVDVGNHRFLKL